MFSRVKINRFPHNHARLAREKENGYKRVHIRHPCTHVSFSHPGSRVKRGRKAFFLAPRRDRVANGVALIRPRRGLVAIFQRARLRHEGKSRKAARGKNPSAKARKRDCEDAWNRRGEAFPMGFCALRTPTKYDESDTDRYSGPIPKTLLGSPADTRRRLVGTFHWLHSIQR